MTTDLTNNETTTTGMNPAKTPAMEMTEQSYPNPYQELSYRELEAKYEQAQARELRLEYKLVFYLLTNIATMILLIAA